jgi:hypothetical protein
MKKHGFKKLISLVGVAVIGVGLASAPAYAVPALQLDIAGGFYDSTTQTVLTSDSAFTVYALLDTTGRPGMLSSPTDTYYLSVAIAPLTSVGGNLGSFSVNGTTVNATSDMTYGTPPLEGLTATFDPGDLAAHGSYPTYFTEFAFTFNPLNTSGVYDSQLNPGGIQAGSGLLYAAFQVDRSLLSSPYQLHFDLYNQKLREGDIDVRYFAPFSHDAGTTARGVPEPSAALLMGIGLLGFGLWQRRRASQSA